MDNDTVTTHGSDLNQPPTSNLQTPTMNINIRKAVQSDCPAMLELIKELAIYEKEPEAVTVTLDHFEESGFGEQPVWWAYVAEISNPNEFDLPEALNLPTGKAIIGFALYYIRYSTWKGQRLYLEDLLITEKMRGKGLGKLLFDQLIVECKEKKYSGMAWQVLDWNEPAINFYKKYEGLNMSDEWLNCMINF